MKWASAVTDRLATSAAASRIVVLTGKSPLGAFDAPGRLHGSGNTRNYHDWLGRRPNFQAKMCELMQLARIVLLLGLYVGISGVPGTASGQTTDAVPATTAAAAASSAFPALDQFEFQAREVGYVPTERFLKFMNDAESGIRQAGMFEGKGPLAILLLVFIGG